MTEAREKMLLSEKSVRENILTWRHSVIDVMVTSPFDSLLWLENRIPNIIYASILRQLERQYHNLHVLYQLKSFAANFLWLRLASLFLYHDFRRPLPYKFLQLALHKNMSGSHMTKSKHFHWVKLVRGKTKCNIYVSFQEGSQTYCFAHVGRSMGWSVLVSFNLVQLLTQERFAIQASNLVGT